MANAESTSSVVAALCGNLFVTAIKFVAFVLSGSGAMLSEAIHSAADTGNQLLLFIGLRRAKRERDEEFHYGYGGDRFVFGLLSASGIFFVGCGVSIYHGIHSLMHPAMPEVGPLTYGVLAVSLLIEGSVLLIAFRSANKQRGSTPFFKYLKEGADPATLAILLEDGVAVTGVLIAAAALALARVTGIAQLDAVASLLIGALLGLVAVFLVVENRRLLLGSAIPDGVEEKFIAIVEAWPSVAMVRDVKTRRLTPEAYTLKAEVRFRPEYFATRMSHPPEASNQTVVATTLRLLSADIDAMENALRAAIPQAKHIDIEVDQTGAPDEADAPASAT